MELLQKALYLIEKNHTFLDGLDEKEADEVYNFLMSLPEQTESLQKRVEDALDVINSENSGLSAEQRLWEIEQLLKQGD